MIDLYFAAVLAAGNEVTVALLGVISIAITAIGAWLAVKRAKSGKIETTEAAELWKESTAMRAELRTEVLALQAEIKALKDENKELKTENAAWRRRITVLEEQLDAMRQSEDVLRDRIRELERSHG